MFKKKVKMHWCTFLSCLGKGDYLPVAAPSAPPIKWQKSDAKADMLLVALREKKHLPSPPHFANFKSYHRGITGSLEIR